MKYNCSLCNYFTDDRKNYSHHKKTKKHIENVSKQNDTAQNRTTPHETALCDSDKLVNHKDNNNINHEKKYICQICNIEFTRADTLVRHQKKYCSMKAVQEVKMDYIIKEKESLEKQLQELRKEKEEEKKKLEEQLLYYRDVMYKKTENDCNMTNLNFLNKHYADAPALEGPKDLHKLFNADKNANPEVYYANLASELGSHHRLNILHKVISEFIVKEYCKEDKTKQSVWNSDSSRLNYIIKECIQKDKMWIMDKNGKTLLEKVINPIIKYIKPDLEEATKRILSFSSKPNGITFMDMKDHQALLEIGNNIMNNTLQEDILKELTGHFNINQKLLLKDIKEKKKELGDKKPEIKMIQDIEKNDDKDVILDYKKKLMNMIKEINITLDKLRNEQNRLDCLSESDDEEDNKRLNRIKEIDDKKKELKNKKKEYNKYITEYNEIENKITENDKEEELISNDTESEEEKEKERQKQISKISRNRKLFKYKKNELDKQVGNFLKI